MPKIVTLRIEASLIEPLAETLESRAEAWQQTARILRDQGKTDSAAQRMATVYAALVQQIREQQSAL